MTRILRIADDMPTMLESTTMKAQGLSEQQDLEQWIVANPELVDPTLTIVTTQFSKWESGVGFALERLDVLALATSGELVVLELKRQSDRNIHLQAVTYGALVAGFTEETLAVAHADWLSRSGKEPVSQEDALARLKSHVDTWSESLLRQVRLILVAESFPAQVLTTVEWLNEVAPSLQIECHEYTVFRDGGGLTVAFDRLYPVVDIQSQMLKPGGSRSTVTEEQKASNQRRARSVAVIHEHRAIPAGAMIELDLKGSVRPDVVERVETWLDEDAKRKVVTWHQDPSNPLKWAAASEPDRLWTPSALRNEIFKLAGEEQPNFSAADAWTYQGKSLYRFADEVVSNAVDREDIPAG